MCEAARVQKDCRATGEKNYFKSVGLKPYYVVFEFQ
jgi:hypothetical protein